ncbi:MAG: hypothetical protein U1E28_04105 [Beijerinckiaceae bacterium]
MRGHIDAPIGDNERQSFREIPFNPMQSPTSFIRMAMIVQRSTTKWPLAAIPRAASQAAIGKF